MPRGNPSPKLAITVEPAIYQLVIDAAATDRVSVSAWMTEAARRRLRTRDGLLAVAEWERENGVLTDDEMNDARSRVAGVLAASAQLSSQSAAKWQPSAKRPRTRRSAPA